MEEVFFFVRLCGKAVQSNEIKQVDVSFVRFDGEAVKTNERNVYFHPAGGETA
jgi:hypothetical protein